MNRYSASRFVLKQLVFPQEVYIEEYHVRTRKRRFPFFWIVNEQSISLSKVASIKIHKGLFFSDIVIENSGGDYPIKIEGFSNGVAKKLRDELEMKERKLAPLWMAKSKQREQVEPLHEEVGVTDTESDIQTYGL